MSKIVLRRTSLAVQWLRLHASTAGGAGSIPSQGTRSHMSQLKSSHAATETQHSQGAQCTPSILGVLSGMAGLRSSCNPRTLLFLKGGHTAWHVES